MTDYIEDNYIEPEETCEWLWEGHLCGIDDPEQMCSECPNLTEAVRQRLQENEREFWRNCRLIQ